MKKSDNKIALKGFIFGLIAPVIGLFFGLQVSTTIGNILTFPLIAMSLVGDLPFGNWSGLLRIIGFAFSGGVWALIFLALSKLRHK